MESDDATTVATTTTVEVVTWASLPRPEWIPVEFSASWCPAGEEDDDEDGRRSLHRRQNFLLHWSDAFSS